MKRPTEEYYVVNLVVAFELGALAMLLALAIIHGPERLEGQFAIKQSSDVSRGPAGLLPAGSSTAKSALQFQKAPPGLPPAVHAAIDLVWATETARGKDLRVGDGGRAHGQLQQHRGHWERGCKWLGVDWPYPQDAYDRDKAFAVAIANWYRDARPYLDAGDVEELIRRFRLPFAPYRSDNDAYLARVMRNIKM